MDSGLVGFDFEKYVFKRRTPLVRGKCVGDRGNMREAGRQEVKSGVSGICWVVYRKACPVYSRRTDTKASSLQKLEIWLMN